MKIAIIFLGFILLVAFLLLLLLYKFQERLIFFPEKLPIHHFFRFNEKFEELNFHPEENVTINALLFYADSPKGLIIYFHGNAGSLNSWGEVAKDLIPFNYDVLIADFRGYGKSTGVIENEEQLHKDATFVYNEMMKKYPEQKMIVYGRSLGSGIASKLSAAFSPSALILETPFYSMTDIARTYYPVLPASLILKYKFENYAWLQKANCPVYLIHGTKDEIVPYNSSSRLAGISAKIKLFTIEGGAHNNLSDFPEYHASLKSILY